MNQFASTENSSGLLQADYTPLADGLHRKLKTMRDKAKQKVVMEVDDLGRLKEEGEK